MSKKFDLVCVSCPSCESTDASEMFETKDYQFQVTDQIFKVQKCKHCGSGYLSPRPKKEDIPFFYNDDFYWAHEGGKRDGSAAILLEKRRSQLEIKERLLEACKLGRLLDIGTQKGEFLQWMKDLGWEVEGIEFVETPQKLFDVDISYGEFLDLDFSQNQFDCVTMWAVLEHIYEPRVYVKKVHQILSPEGRFIGVVTNFNCPQGRWYGKDDYPRHLTIFTKKALRIMLEEAGFEVERFWTDQLLFGGPLRGGIVFAMKRLLGYSRHEVMAEWHDRTNPMAFCAEYKGHKSWWIQQLSRLDKILLMPVELLLDRLGMGQNLYWSAIKRN